MQGIGYLSIMVLLLRTSIVYTNSQFPSFLVDEQDGVIVLRCTGLYPAFL